DRHGMKGEDDVASPTFCVMASDVQLPRGRGPMKIGPHVIRTYRNSPNEFSQELFEGLPKRYNVLAELLSFGQDLRWRSAMVNRVAGSQPGLILDVACGPGAVTRRLAKKTTAHIVGLDLSEAMLARGQVDIAHAGIDERVSLVRAR